RRMPLGSGDPFAFAECFEHEPFAERRRHDVADRAAHQRRRRGERGQRHEFFPHRLHDIVAEHRIDLAACEGGQRRIAARRAFARDLAERQALHAADMMDLAGRIERRADIAGATQDARRAEAPAQRRHVVDAVEQRQHRALRAERRRNGSNGAVEVIGLGGEQDDIVGLAQLLGEDGAHRPPYIAQRAVHDEAVLGQLPLAPRPYQERDIRTTFEKTAAVIAADGAGTEHQKPHIALRIGVLPGRMLAVRPLVSPPENIGWAARPQSAPGRARRAVKYLEIKGTRIPALGLGTWQLSGSACVTAVSEALALGYRHIDTAQMYGNEAEVGRALRQSGIPRGDIFVTTKLAPGNLAAADVRRSSEESLRKLGLDHVDLLLIHWPSGDAPLGETLAAMGKLRAAGKARFIGVSNFNVKLLDEAIERHGADLLCDQVEYHPFLSQRAVLAALQRRGMMLTAYSPV